MTRRAHAFLSALLILPPLVMMGQGCSSSSSTPSGNDEGTGDAGSDGSNGSSREVSACTDCSAGELCLDVKFTDGPCNGSGSGSDGDDCPEGTTQTGGCCQENDSDTYYCYATPTGCATPVTCGCASSIVVDACDGNDLDDVQCAQIAGGLSCVQDHD